MFIYVIRRLFWAIPTLLGVSILVFSMVHMVPGDPAVVLLGERANKRALEEIRKQLGLDKPLQEQYWIFLKGAVRGDFGQSIKSKESAMKEFFDRFPATLELSLVSMFFATLIGILVGIVSAVKRYSVFDYLGMFGALAGVSMPVFWLGLILIYVFSIYLDLLPVSSRLSVHFYIENVTGLYLVDSLLAGDFNAFGDAVRHLILPSIALSTIPMAIIARMTRSSMLEVMREDYVRTAKAKGCPPSHVILIHGLRNALIPVVTVMGLSMGALLAGAVLTETTFSWPGIGKWLVDAVYRRDFPVIQCATIVIAVMFIMLNLFVDLIYALINPKIRLQ